MRRVAAEAGVLHRGLDLHVGVSGAADRVGGHAGTVRRLRGAALECVGLDSGRSGPGSGGADHEIVAVLGHILRVRLALEDADAVELLPLDESGREVESHGWSEVLPRQVDDLIRQAARLVHGDARVDPGRPAGVAVERPVPRGIAAVRTRTGGAALTARHALRAAARRRGRRRRRVHARPHGGTAHPGRGSEAQHRGDQRERRRDTHSSAGPPPVRSRFAHDLPPLPLLRSRLSGTRPCRTGVRAARIPSDQA